VNALLSVRGLSVAFGGVRALADVGFEAPAGAITALVGPNGAGKTTAVNCISGHYAPLAGSVRFHGREATRTPAHVLARMGLTRTFQNLQVFSRMNVLENVMVGLSASTRRGFLSAMLRLPGHGTEEARIEQRAMAELERFGLADKASLPAGALAYGERKLLELARALVSEPRMVLLDEPVAGLNPAETDEVGAAIIEMRDAGLGVVLVEHDMALVMRVSDQVVVLASGEVIAAGHPRDIQRHPEVVRTYLGGQEATPC
jgi:ABC-type branched-subunit amino acid transport system ATPase component